MTLLSGRSAEDSSICGVSGDTARPLSDDGRTLRGGLPSIRVAHRLISKTLQKIALPQYTQAASLTTYEQDEARAAALPGAPIDPCRFALVSPATDGELRIAIDRGGARQTLTRAFHAIEGATITVAIPPAP